jgi:uncharacterized damage-inducible protein DinB
VERKAQRPSFFGSIHRTLNHILVGDRMWLARILGESHGIASLDQELYGAFDELRGARRTEDQRLIATIGGIGRAGFAGELAYRNMAGDERRQPMVQVLGHIFNHQTHHRGQVHGMLSGTRVAPPPLDISYFPWSG